MTAEDQRRLRVDQEAARPAGQGGHHVGRDRDGRDHPPPALRVGRPARRSQEDRRRLRRLGHRPQQMVGDFDADSASDRFRRPIRSTRRLLSVFERKWQSLPRFQKTRGVLRLLALWVSHAYNRGYKGAHRDPLIGLGTAPLDDPYFRAADVRATRQQRPGRAGHHRHRGQEGRPRRAARQRRRGRDQEGPAAPEGRDGDPVRVRTAVRPRPRRPRPRSAWPSPSPTWTSPTSRPRSKRSRE